MRLQTKATAVAIAITLICILTVGSISIWSINRTANEYSRQYMNELCLDKTHEINEYLDEVVHAVNIAGHYLSENIDRLELMEGGVIGFSGWGSEGEERDWDSGQQKRLDSWLNRHLADSQKLFRSIAYNTPNALTYYYRLNPEFSRKETGFLYMRNGISDFQAKEPVDILAYPRSDRGHVAWYYQALEKGRPSWMTPYLNQNLGVEVLTYLAPVYKAGTFVGVVGMDISYNNLVDKIRHLEIYRTGLAFLTDEYSRIVYHPEIPMGNMMPEVIDATSAENMQSAQEGTSQFEYTRNGIRKRAAWRTLSNGLRLFVAAPVEEIEESWARLVRQLILTGMGLIVLFITLVTILVSRVTRPLRHLASAAEQVEKGNYDVDLSSRRKDEIGTVTRSFGHLTAHLKTYIDDLNSKAYRDALTGVKNKAALDIYAANLDKEDPEQRRYAVVLFDCNRLKQINDLYGHDRGDQYLKFACRMICKGFSTSPVFRVGGDEFVAILQGDAYDSRQEDIARFRETMETGIRNALVPWEAPSVALGLAVYNPAGREPFSEVLHHADAEMYQDKERSHAQESPAQA